MLTDHDLVSKAFYRSMSTAHSYSFLPNMAFRFYMMENSGFEMFFDILQNLMVIEQSDKHILTGTFGRNSCFKREILILPDVIY